MFSLSSCPKIVLPVSYRSPMSDSKNIKLYVSGVLAVSCKTVPFNFRNSPLQSNIYEDVLCAWCHQYGHLFGFTCDKFVAAYKIYGPHNNVGEKTGNYDKPLVTDKTPIELDLEHHHRDILQVIMINIDTLNIII